MKHTLYLSLAATLALGTTGAFAVSHDDGAVLDQDLGTAGRQWTGDVVELNTQTVMTDLKTATKGMAQAINFAKLNQTHDAVDYDFTSLAFNFGDNSLVTSGGSLNPNTFADGRYLVLDFMSPITQIKTTANDFELGFIGFDNEYRNLIGLDIVNSDGARDDIGLFEYGGSIPHIPMHPMGPVNIGYTDVANVNLGSGGEAFLNFWGRFDAQHNGASWDGDPVVDKFYMDDNVHFMGLVGRIYDVVNGVATAEDDLYFMLGFDDDKDRPSNWTDWDDGIILGRLSAGEITPEPASLAAMGVLGLVGIAALRRKLAARK